MDMINYFGLFDITTDFFLVLFLAFLLIPFILLYFGFLAYCMLIKKQRPSFFKIDKEELYLILILLIILIFTAFVMYKIYIEPFQEPKIIKEGDIISIPDFSSYAYPLSIEIKTSGWYVNNGTRLLISGNPYDEIYADEGELVYHTFDPYSVEIKTGDVVYWNIPEEFSIVSGRIINELPQDTNFFASNGTETVALQFNKPGTYYYYSTYTHTKALYNPLLQIESVYMTGRIIVTDWKNSERKKSNEDCYTLVLLEYLSEEDCLKKNLE